MCTVSWIVEDRSYRLYFNRDEQKSRPRAEAPRVKATGATKGIYPYDGQGGGSWIAVNQKGVTAFLLNNYSATIDDNKSAEFRSRGEIPILLASKTDFEESVDAIHK